MVIFNPIEDKLIIEAIKKELKSSGGIIIPDVGKEDAMSGKVLAVGPGRTLDSGAVKPMMCNVGDTVVYPKFGALILKYEDKEYIVIAEKDLFAIVDTRTDADRKVLADALAETADDLKNSGYINGDGTLTNPDDNTFTDPKEEFLNLRKNTIDENS